MLEVLQCKQCNTKSEPGYNLATLNVSVFILIIYNEEERCNNECKINNGNFFTIHI